MREFMDIHDLQDEFVVCRALGHSWDDNPGAVVDSELFKAAQGVLALRCVRCTTERFDYIAKDMTVWQRYYRYPAKYTTIPGQGTRPNLRAELFKRSLLVRRHNGKRK
jgi:hypothetical protein